MAIVLKNLAQVTLPEEHRREVLELFVHTNRDGVSIRNYKYKDGVAYLPLNMRKLSYVAELLKEPIDDQRSPGVDPSTLFTLNPLFTFREHQTKPANDLVAFCLFNNYAVLKAPCSCGKTVVMTYAAGKLGRKVLIIVDMGSIQSQWAEAFELVWGKKVQILDRSSREFADVCVTTFQLLHLNPELVIAIRTHFGTLLLDEVHTTQSDTRREVLFKMNNKYRIGCSATMMKKGYSDDVLTDLVADVSVEMTDPNALSADVFFVDSGVRFYSNNSDDWGKITSKLGSSDVRNAFVAALVLQQVKAGRRVLLIGATVESLKVIAGILKGCEECRVTIYTGSTSLAQDQALRKNLADGTINVIGTVKKADKALDLPNLDCLILARPANNEAFVTQIAGRIVRPVDGKPTPEIYDVVDRGELAVRFAGNRRRWYRKLGYSVQNTIDK